MRKILGGCMCARTSARIQQHADEEHKEQDPKTRGQTNLVTFVYCFVCLCLHARVLVLRVYCLFALEYECVC